MNHTFIDFESQACHSSRQLHINLIDTKENVLSNINTLNQQLESLLLNQTSVKAEQHLVPTSRAKANYLTERISELQGMPCAFKTSQLPDHYEAEEMILALEGLALSLEKVGVKLVERGTIVISDYATLYYDKAGCITHSEPDLGLKGLYAIEVLAGFIAQDFGLIIERNNKLYYFYSSARFEKTPKHVENGYDYFVGEDFLEWHKRIPIWGSALSHLLQQLFHVFCAKKLDVLTIDLKGRHQYTDGNIIVRRYERDYAVPLINRNGQTMGMIVFADSLFKKAHETLSFFEGKHLHINSPQQFHQHFKIIKHEHFTHHPFGMRHPDGTEVKTTL